MDERANFGGMLDAARIQRLRAHGAIVLDVDDTLLARERADGGEESFAQSGSASLLPRLLENGFRICLITGHGWSQLESRLIGPLLDQIKGAGRADAIERLHIYANRGATKIFWNGERFVVSETYSSGRQLDPADVDQIRSLLKSQGEEMMVDLGNRSAWYRETFPGFDFDQLPPSVTLREDAVLVLRPIPSTIHLTKRAGCDGGDVRANLCENAASLLNGLRLNGEYEVATAGRSSIEITRRGVSKETAMRDLVSDISAVSGAEAHQIEHALVYIGDEFFPGGNDFVVASDFPDVLCFSVVERVEIPPRASKVVNLPPNIGLSGTSATEALLRHVLDLSI